jgi:hypothetical protein
MNISVREAIRQTSDLLRCLLDIENQNQLIDFKFIHGKLGYTYKVYPPMPMFDSVSVHMLNIQVGDLVYFDYRDQSGAERVRRGYVQEVTSNSILIFDLEKNDFRRSTVGGITRLYRLVEHIPF